MTDRKPERRGLGRGLSALMADVAPADDGRVASQRAETHVPIERILPNPEQPRRHFPEDALEELASSIREKGVLQPLIVRPSPKQADSFEIVAGERRWRAAQKAQLHELPVIVRDFSDAEVLEIAIIENIQRVDLNPVEEATGFRLLQDRFGHTQEKLAEALGKSRSHIANLLRLLQLPDEVLDLLRNGIISGGHARALITADDPAALARQVVSRRLSVRETETLARGDKPARARKPRARGSEKDADTRALEGDLSANLRMPVAIDHDTGRDGGRLVLRYANLAQLDRLCQALSSIDMTNDF